MAEIEFFISLFTFLVLEILTLNLVNPVPPDSGDLEFIDLDGPSSTDLVDSLTSTNFNLTNLTNAADIDPGMDSDAANLAISLDSLDTFCSEAACVTLGLFFVSAVVFISEGMVCKDPPAGIKGDDATSGYGGNDPTTVSDGDDRAPGGGGNNATPGGVGNDIPTGGDGNDSSEGGSGNDASHGGVGNDTSSGIVGANASIGGLGCDIPRTGLTLGEMSSEYFDPGITVDGPSPTIDPGIGDPSDPSPASW